MKRLAKAEKKAKAKLDLAAEGGGEGKESNVIKGEVEVGADEVKDEAEERIALRVLWRHGLLLLGACSRQSFGHTLLI